MRERPVLVGQVAAATAATEDAGGASPCAASAGPAYEIETFLTPLSTVAKETKHMDASYIANGNNITEAFKQYARPLVGELPSVNLR